MMILFYDNLGHKFVAVSIGYDNIAVTHKTQVIR